MATVLVHPSRGARDGRENLKRSLEIQVDFLTTPTVHAALSDDEVAELLARHPDGKARFWGTYEGNAALIARVHEGDVVLFTGQNRVWAVGVVGLRFTNTAFAEAVWLAHPEKGTYRHIYSLVRFEPVDVPYSVVNNVLGYEESYHFQGMVVYDGSRADALIDELRLDVPETLAANYLQQDEDLAVLLGDEALAGAALIPLEAVHKEAATITVQPGERVMLRGEGKLVQAYAATIADAVAIGRQRTPAGVTDMWIQRPDNSELVEAKSVASTGYVRQALAQLLHYASAISPGPDVLTALFPTRPSDADVGLLNRYGIDCVYRVAAQEYERVPAQSGRRDLVAQFWA